MRKLVILVVTLLPVLAHAQPAARDPITEAKEHYRRGTQLYDLGKYVEAAKEYEESFSLSDRAPLLFNVGQAYRLAGRGSEAIAAYRGFVRRVPESPLRAEAEQHIAELEQAAHATTERGSEKPNVARPDSDSRTNMTVLRYDGIEHRVHPPLQSAVSSPAALLTQSNIKKMGSTVTEDSPARTRRLRLGVFAWTLLGTGVASMAAGAALIAVDGRGTCVLPAGQRRCPLVHDTLSGGAALAAVGGAALVSSTALFLIRYRPRRVAFRVSPLGSGITFALVGSF